MEQPYQNFSQIPLWCTQRDSNPHQQNRNLQFYPLNYGYIAANILIPSLVTKG